MRRFIRSVLTLVVARSSLFSAQVVFASVPSISVVAVPTNEGLIGMQVTFSLSSPAVGGGRLNFDLVEGQATFADFIPFDVGIVEFEPGDTSQSISITMFDDFLPELDETFQIALSNPAGLTFAAPSHPLTILNDDGAALLPSFFSDGMVLQREKGAKFWGYHWEEVEIIIGGDKLPQVDRRFARVRVLNNE